MSDISKCIGFDCPIRDKCLRFTAKSGYWQSWVGGKYDKTVNNIHVWDIYNELTQQRSDYKKAYNEGIDKASDESQMDFNDFKLK